ncbi:MAG: hypothetical protein PHG02_09145 [Oscillospiraceae bacterium]|nr:hypothetical protein [Oscillospiraceae bacterium]
MAALGILFLIFILLACGAIAGLFLVKQPKLYNVIFVLSGLFGVLLCYIAMSALPQNEVVKMYICALWGTVGAAGIVLQYVVKKFPLAAKICVCISIVCSLACLFWL